MVRHGRMGPRQDCGFTLMELMMATALIVVLSAIAIPGLLRARMSSNESSALGSLRAVLGAQGVFAASCGSGFFAPTMVLLGTPPSDGGDAFLGADLANSPILKSRYVIKLTPGPVAPASPPSCNGAAAGSMVHTYFVGADSVNVGGRYFGANQGATLYESGAAVVVTQNGPPPGATPVH
jgi:prepilin-type N-terminal cleavage/methylation domain-containing protein